MSSRASVWVTAKPAFSPKAVCPYMIPYVTRFASALSSGVMGPPPAVPPLPLLISARPRMCVHV